MHVERVKMNRTLSTIMFVLLLVSTLTFAFNTQNVRASGTIYIMADGSIDPPTAPIQRNGDVYTLTGNITSDANGIVIERDNITLDGAGYTLQGPEGTGYIGMTNGTYIVGRTNVTIRNLQIRNFWAGVSVDASSDCTLLSNEMVNNGNSIRLARSSNNSIIGNRLTASASCAIHIWPSPSYDNCILENNITDARHGIITFCPRNHISNNIIVNCVYGIDLIYSSNSTVSNNTLSSAGLQVHGSYGNVVENNVVNGKPLVYLEDASDQTVEDAGQVILVNCNSIRVENLSLSDTSYPVQMWGTNNSRITNNNITANTWNGIQLYYSSNNTLEGNNIAEKHYHGVHFYSSSYNTLRNNSLSADNYFNFFVDGSNLSHFVHDVDTSNTVNGRPIYYWINKTETSVPLDAGYVALVNCTRMTVQNLTLAKNAQAIVLAFTTNSTVIQNYFTKNEYDIYLCGSQDNNITRNNMTNDWYGVCLRNSLNNTIQENTVMWSNYYGILTFNASHNRIVKNTIAAWYGIWLESSSNNLIFHNNFVGTTTHEFFSRDSVNVWDYGYPSGGNYWSDYVGLDSLKGPYQNETGSDGIGDTPYVIDAHNVDHYPLMNSMPDVAVTSVISGKTDCDPFPTIGRNYTLAIRVTVENQAVYAETVNVTVQILATEIGRSTNVSVAGRSSVTLDFSWDTTSWEYGNYSMRALAEPLLTEYDTSDNSFEDCWILLTIPGDINGDQKVNVLDAIRIANSFNSKPSDANWNPNADINCDNKVNILDCIVLANYFNQSWP